MSDLKERVDKFNGLSLPGQPMAMHMGTSYLVNDLWREVQRLRGEPQPAPVPEWQPIETRPSWDHQPCRQFIRLEGSRSHHGSNWARVYCGEAFIRKPGGDDELLQYRKDDILRLCRDGDIDVETAQVTHWMPATFPAIPANNATTSHD